MKKSIFDRSHPARRKLNWLDPSKLAPEGELLHLWSSPFYIYQQAELPSWHIEMKAAIKAKSSSPEINANWKKSDFFQWAYPESDHFVKFLNQHVHKRLSADYGSPLLDKLRWQFNGWANYKHQEADWHWNHIHAGAYFSFVYYLSSLPSAHVDTEQPDFNGGYYHANLEFMDPRGAAPYMVRTLGYNSMEQSKFFIPPTEGMLLIFPSYCWHMVSPMNEPGERISVAGNVTRLWVDNG